ncbi:hypothetical protein A9K75_09175 [Campylobacter fetus subsp. testudinum]|uniref:hypothetical protein n=1 Tax=Campylobacter fetus TaxID=196 RepID=UPI00081882BB|nr:hypothetical protein [Campylobacter fetus]OCR98955.1 hypothetical protein A9K75_09175 [Campylobacter fetus subsp. testudinum]
MEKQLFTVEGINEVKQEEMEEMFIGTFLNNGVKIKIKFCKNEIYEVHKSLKYMENFIQHMIEEEK